MSKTEPSCFGRGYEDDAICGKCVCADRCKVITSKLASGEPAEDSKNEGQPSVPEVPLENQNTPVEHFLKSLEGRFDYKKNENKKAVGHFFSKSGVSKVLVTVAKGSSRIRIQTATAEKFLDSIGSVEEAEGILAEILG